VNASQKEHLLRELIELTEIPSLQPTDISLQEYADAVNLTRSAARQRLDKLVASGQYIGLLVRCPDGRVRRVYRRAATNKEE
jgi:predicted ArsR family transcriptional regulator